MCAKPRLGNVWETGISRHLVDQMRAPLIPFRPSQHYCFEMFKGGGFNWASNMPREASLSDSWFIFALWGECIHVCKVHSIWAKEWNKLQQLSTLRKLYFYFLNPLNMIVLWCTGCFRGPEIGPPWCRETLVSRTANKADRWRFSCLAVLSHWEN